MQAIKGALKSRTVWLAILQAALGVVVVILTEADMLGYAAWVKSLIDIIVRADTSKPLSDR